jgi:hypothetical protein
MLGSTTHYALPTTNLLSHWPTDWIVVGALAALIALDALRSGSARAIAVAIAAPLALVLSSTLSSAFLFVSIAPQLQSPAAQALTVGVLFVLLFFLIHRLVRSFGELGGPLQALVAGIAAAAVVLVVWQQVPALQSLWHFGPQVQLVFGATYRFWWMLLAYAGLAYIRG